MEGAGFRRGGISLLDAGPEIRFEGFLDVDHTCGDHFLRGLGGKDGEGKPCASDAYDDGDGDEGSTPARCHPLECIEHCRLL